MEIKTTLVMFDVPKNKMDKQTEKAVLIEVEGDKIWIPLKKILIKDNKNKDFNTVVMPRWVFLKTNLPFYFNPVEIEHTSTISEIND